MGWHGMRWHGMGSGEMAWDGGCWRGAELGTRGCGAQAEAGASSRRGSAGRAGETCRGEGMLWG